MRIADPLFSGETTVRTGLRIAYRRCSVEITLGIEVRMADTPADETTLRTEMPTADMLCSLNNAQGRIAHSRHDG